MLDVSIIVPALKRDNQLSRCIYSIQSSLNGISHEILLVVPANTTIDGGYNGVRVLIEEDSGVYGAMNTGLLHASGKYSYFLGQDDVLLPEFSNVLKQGMASDSVVILADVFWGRRKIYRNRKSKYSLVNRNWCHQGVIYRSDFLKGNRLTYKTEYRTQADHFLNIEICKLTRKITKYTACIAWYSADGFSTRVIDTSFRSDFPRIVNASYGFPFLLCVLARRVLKILFSSLVRNKSA